MNAREWADKDYYADLGVSSSATADEIKKAYRKLARENHPDKNPGDKRAEERFKRAAEAYDIIGDEKKRAEYDETKALLASGGFGGFGGKGGPGFPGGFPQGSAGFQPGGFDPSGLFNSAGSGPGFGGDGSLGDILGGLFNRSRGPRRAATPSRGANLETDITIDFKEAVLGSSLPIELTRNITCTDCKGSGSATGHADQCPDCQGTGMTSEEKGAFGFSAPCARCHGTGQIVSTPCSRCHGAGTVRATKSITVKIPPGVEDGSKLRLAGKGEAGPQGRPSGDLFVNVHVRPDPVFTREGKDLDVSIPVSFAELALGTTLSVPTMTDPVRVKIAPGTPSGRRLRLRGRGVPGSTPGDLYATVNVVVPKDLGPAATSALRAYAQAEKEQGFTPRPDATG